MEAVALASLEAGERVTVHHWFDRAERTLELTPRTAPEQLERVRWRDVYYVEAHGDPYTHYVDPHRLFDLPVRLARELLETSVEPDCAETWRLRESLRRALEQPHRFNRAAYTPFSWETRARAEDTERRLAAWPDADAPHHYPPWDWQTRIKLGHPEHPGHRDVQEQLGVHTDERGRCVVTPLDPELAKWAARLVELDTSPTYLNGVPVRRLPCVPLRFEVTIYELTAEVGLGTGGRNRRTQIMTRLEAAAFIRAGSCPHHRLGSDGRWRETST